MLTSSCLRSIIFIHGLTGDREETWRAKDAIAPWPQTLLPAKLTNARILTFGYDAYVADWRGVVAQNRIGNHAMNLLTAVATYREYDDTVCFRLLQFERKQLTAIEWPPNYIRFSQLRWPCL